MGISPTTRVVPHTAAAAATSSSLQLILITTMLIMMMIPSGSTVNPATIGSSSNDDEFAKEKQLCAPQLVGLAPCLPFVQDGATAKAPTPDCCGGIKPVLDSSKKCICLLIKYKDDPQLGFKINATAALTLPSLCNHPFKNISECSALLNLAPDSALAKEFEDYARMLSGNTTTPTTTTTNPPAITSSTSSGSSSKSGPQVESDGGEFGGRLAARQIVYGFAVNLLVYCIRDAMWYN
ncbi:hypothetical protein Dimus_011652 [Dionaea muscipula]